MTESNEGARVEVPYPHPMIAREGWPFIVFSGGLAVMVLFVAGPEWSALFWLITLFVLQFFRDPPRSAPVDAAAVLSPADGRVMVVARETDPYLQREALKISVFMNVFNVHSNRSPVRGRVEQAWYHEGSFLNAALDKASLENERNALWIKTDDGTDVTCVQVAGLVARRILCYAGPGDALTRGQRYGFIRFGSRVDVYLPPTARPAVSVGDKVSATASILARIGS